MTLETIINSVGEFFEMLIAEASKFISHLFETIKNNVINLIR